VLGTPLDAHWKETAMYVATGQRLGQTQAGRQPDIVRIILIDSAGDFRNNHQLRSEFASRLEHKFNNIDRNWLRQAHLRFSVQYRSKEPTTAEKAEFGKLDFPVYLLGRQHGYKTIQELMRQHKIPSIIKGQDPYDLAKKCWEKNHTRGCGIPSGEGFRKVGFIKTHRIIEDATGDLWRAFVNVTAHEIGHMGNRLLHSKTGLMKYLLPLNIDIDFDQNDKYLFLSDLLRLRAFKPKVIIQQFQWAFR
jgi:hypothetical protein